MASPYVFVLLFAITFQLHCMSGCHQPPVSDNHLVALIKAFNDGDVENSIHAWMCRRCANPKKKQDPSAVPPLSHRSDEPQSSRLQQTILGQSSDDPIEILDPPSPKHTVTASSTLPVQSVTSLYAKYNLYPSWIRNRHPNLQTNISLPSLPQSRASRRLSARRGPSAAVRDPFNFSCLTWLSERRQSATSTR